MSELLHEDNVSSESFSLSKMDTILITVIILCFGIILNQMINSISKMCKRRAKEQYLAEREKRRRMKLNTKDHKRFKSNLKKE